MMKHTHIVLCALAALVACNRNDSANPSEPLERQLASVSVSCQEPKAAPGMRTADEGDGSGDNGEDASAIIISDFQVGDRLYFSQMGPSDDPNFEHWEATASPYLYVYEYNGEEASWNAGYNFSCVDDRTMFDWETVKQIGSVGNTFSLYAFHFPVDNTVKFGVQTDQRGPEEDRFNPSNFMRSDILGAYHATSSLYTRLRFRLFHLMVYLKVTIYVPDYEDRDDGTEKSFSGFKAGALKGAYVMNASTDFDIEWHANRSSDTEAPLTQTQANGTKQTITMYRHNSDETQVIEDFEVKNYYTGGTIEFDRVRAYNFSVLFPSQSFSDNFLCFALQAPDDAMKYYYFAGTQIVGDKGLYSLAQGTLQQLYLYLPRTTNETILVGAKILPWSDSVTDMTVTKQDTAQD